MRAEPAVAPSRRSSSRSEEHTSELQSLAYLVCRLLLEKKKDGAGAGRRPRGRPRPADDRPAARRPPRRHRRPRRVKRAARAVSGAGAAVRRAHQRPGAAAGGVSRAHGSAAARGRQLAPGRRRRRRPRDRHDAVGPRWATFFFFVARATTVIYTLSLHDALPI